MRASVRLRLPGGDVATLGHGDLIGRVWSATLQIEDPRISEAHAMVSLRGDQLVLLALRGRFRISGKVLQEAVLVPSQQIWLTPDLPVEVVEVRLPDEVLAIEAPGLDPTVLPGTCALLAPPAVVAPGHKDAVAHVWAGADDWWLRPTGGVARRLLPDDTVSLGGVSFTALLIRRPGTEADGTVSDGGVATPVTVIAQFDTVHIQRDGFDPVVLDGLSARIVSELVAVGGPVAWRVLADEVWGGDEDESRLRKRLDIAMVRLRRRLSDGKVRTDLVRANGRGQYELFLHADDAVEDRT